MRLQSSADLEAFRDAGQTIDDLRQHLRGDRRRHGVVVNSRG